MDTKRGIPVCESLLDSLVGIGDLLVQLFLLNRSAPLSIYEDVLCDRAQPRVTVALSPEAFLS